jgi:hypothetical protein
MVRYLPQYRWKPQRSNFTEEDSAERPRKKDDHNIDNLGHILVAMDEELPDASVSAFQEAVGIVNTSAAKAEARELDEHFETELMMATAMSPYSGPNRSLRRLTGAVND